MSIKTITAALFLLAAGTAQGAIIAWTDWTDFDFESAHGTVDGIGVDFTGILSFAQLGPGNSPGPIDDRNYWTEPDPSDAPYTGNSLVDNAPTPNELLAFDTASSNSVIFAETVQSPLMAILSMGQPNLPVTYDFDIPFTVLSEGAGFWGNGDFTLGDGYLLTGSELHAVIQFHGPVSSINWTNSPSEFWHGFTFGLAPTAVPEPGTLGLFGAGLLGVYWARRKARR